MEQLSAPLTGLKEKIAYACGDTASVLYYRSFAMFLMIFYTDVFGISAQQVGLMFLVTRIWDAINDPLMGIVVDRTQTRDGKFRPWLKWMAIPLGLVSIALFTVPDLGPQGKLVYAWVTYVLAGMLYTAINIPYGALMGVMTPHSDERTVLSSFRYYGALAGDLVVKGLTIWLVTRLGAGDEAAGYQRTLIVFAVLASLLFFFTFSGTRERVQPQPEDHGSSWWQDLGYLLRNRPWVVLSVMGILMLIWVSVRGGATLYYFKYYIGNYEKWTAWFLVVGVVANCAGVSLLKFFTGLFRGKRNTFAMLPLLASLAQLMYLVITPDQIALLFGTEIVMSLFTGPLFALFWSMVADTADYGEWKYGRRTTGLAFSAGTFSQKAGWAIGGSIASFLLGFYGYQANVEQSAEAIGGIRSLMGLVPALIGLATVGVTLLYNIDRQLELQMERELRARHAV